MENISAIILAGGKGSRMGTEKGLVEFNGKKLTAYAIAAAKNICRDIYIISSNPAYQQFGLPVFEDVYKDCGPLGGIHAGLTHSATECNLVLGCDLPFITKDFLEFLVSFRNESMAIVPFHVSMAEPLCALYHKSSIPVIEYLIQNKKLKMQSAVMAMHAEFVSVPQEFRPAALFRNFNSPEEITAAQTHPVSSHETF